MALWNLLFFIVEFLELYWCCVK